MLGRRRHVVSTGLLALLLLASVVGGTKPAAAQPAPGAPGPLASQLVGTREITSCAVCGQYAYWEHHTASLRLIAMLMVNTSDLYFCVWEQHVETGIVLGGIVPPHTTVRRFVPPSIAGKTDELGRPSEWWIGEASFNWTEADVATNTCGPTVQP
jgi:hypothetical protein